MIKKSIVILGILVFFLLMCSTVTATSGIIFANGGDGNSKISGNRIIREKNSFWIEMYSGSIRVNIIEVRKTVGVFRRITHSLRTGSLSPIH